MLCSVLLGREMEEEPPPAEPRSKRFVLWLHGLGDSGRANEPVAGYAFAGARWAFPTAPTAAVTCNRTYTSDLLEFHCLLA